MPVVVRQAKMRHGLAKLRTYLSLIQHMEPLNKLIIGLGESGQSISAFPSISRQLSAERSILYLLPRRRMR